MRKLFCHNNKLTYLPILPANLKELQCSNNELTCLPTLPNNLEHLYYNNNYAYEIIRDNNIYFIKKI